MRNSYIQSLVLLFILFITRKCFYDRHQHIAIHEPNSLLADDYISSDRNKGIVIEEVPDQDERIWRGSDSNRQKKQNKVFMILFVCLIGCLYLSL